MNAEGYLFTLNRNGSNPLSSEELQDVIQDLRMVLIGKFQSDKYVRMKAKELFIMAIRGKKKKQELLDKKDEYLFAMQPDDQHRVELQRLAKARQLEQDELKGRILIMLIRGFSFEEIRAKLNMNHNQLKNHIARLLEWNGIQRNKKAAPHLLRDGLSPSHLSTVVRPFIPGFRISAELLIYCLIG